MNYSFTVPSLLILIIIMGYYFFRPRLPIRLNRAFLAILVIDIGTVLFDFTSNRLNETWTQHAPILLWMMNMLFFIFYLSRVYMLYVFSISVLDARGAERLNAHKYTPVFYFSCVALALSSPLTHWLFYIDQNGYHAGPAYNIIYYCSVTYILFSVIAVVWNRRQINTYETTGLLLVQLILLIGNMVRQLFPTFLVMNTFCLMAILVIFLSFINPDLFLSERGYVYNIPAFQALLTEYNRRKRPSRVLGFVIQNYNEHREIFGGRQMDQALALINRYLAETYPHLNAFYLRNGCFALVSLHETDLNLLSKAVRNRFAAPWKTGNGELVMNVSFVQADSEIRNCPADRMLNTLLISLDEMSHASEPEANRSLNDSIELIDQKLDIRRCLENALQNDELEVFLQPIMDCSSGKRIAAEALVRLRDDNGGIIKPDDFITLAEREGYITRLGEQVLEKVCGFIRDNDMEALNVRWINVNLSPLQFMSRNIPERFMGILKEYGVKTDQIHLEITEQSMIDFSLLREQIMGLHKNGFEFALDDYGSGYSNLTRVRQYPFTNIKIDLEVVRSYCAEKDPLLPALIRAFKQMRFSVTAEGIETKEMAEELKDIGCDFLQGYFYSRPIPMRDFIAMGTP